MKKKFLILAIALFVFISGIKTAQAVDAVGGVIGTLFSIGTIAAAPVLVVTLVIGYVTATLSSLLFSLAGLIGGVAINLQSLILSNEFVTTGWKIVRDITNLGFVLIIIVIALATILRREQYGAQKLLPRLIGAAILVNFSLAISGLLINFSQAITNFFFSKISINPILLFSSLAGALDPQQLLNFKSPVDAITGFGTASIMIAISPYFITIFNLIAILVLLTLAFMLIIRFFYLSFLLIISPIVWLFWVIPSLSGQFSKWWNKFFDWLFFAPAVSFFIYLAFTSIDSLKRGTSIGEGARNLIEANVDPTIANLFVPGVNMILISGMLIAGLIAAKSMGIQSANGTIKLLGNVSNKAKGWAGKKASRAGLKTATWPARTEVGKKVTKNLLGVPVPKSRLGRWFASGAVGAIRKTGEGLNRMGAKGEKLPDAYKKDQAPFSDERLGMMLPKLTGPARIAALERLTPKGNLRFVPNAKNYVNKDVENEFKKYGKDNKFKDMQTALEYTMDMAEAMKKEDEKALREATKKFFDNLSKEDFGKLPTNAIFGKDPAFGFSENQMELLRKSIIYGIADSNEGNLTKLLMEAKPANFTRVHSNITRVAAEINVSDPEKGKTIAKILDKILVTRKLTGFHSAFEEEKKEKEEETKEAPSGEEAKK